MLAECLALALLLAAPADPKLEAAEAQGRKSVEATFRGDYETLLDLTHPRLVAAMGGRGPASEGLRKEVGRMSERGFAFSSSQVEAASGLQPGRDGLYCMVPFTLKMKYRGKTIAKKSALLGFSADDGKTWTFADVTPGEETIRKLLPEIPRGVAFPKPEKPTVEADQP